MSDYRTMLKRDLDRVGPAPFSFDDVARRLDRKRRTQRITAAIVGIAVFVAAVWIVRDVVWLDRTQTLVPGVSGATGPKVNETGNTAPTYTLGPVTHKDIAVGESFMSAWVDGDGEAAAAMFSPGGTFDGLQPAILPALHDWFRAGGWTFEGGGCGIHGYDADNGVVGCGFTFENDLTRALGISNRIETTLSFVIVGGRIETAFYGGGGDVGPHLFGTPNFRPVWYAFVDWLSSQHPEDFVRMYDAESGYPILNAASIELWARYTGEFVASPEAQTLAQSIRDAGWDGVGIPPEGSAPSTPAEGELIADYAELHVGSVFVYADGRVISNPFGSGVVDEQRLTSEGVDLVRSGVVPPRKLLPPYSWSDLPASAWADHETTPFVPSRYAVCFYQESGGANPGTVNGGYEYPSTVLRFFPAGARDILSDKAHSFGRSGDVLGPGSVECSEISTDEARELDATLTGLRVEDAQGDQIFWEINALLPHGEWVTQGG